jgi:hypothetical protein
MKITGASNDASNSLTASNPELPSASWISARISPGRFFFVSAEHAMTKPFHQRLELHRDEGVILDDQNVGGDLGRKLAARVLDQSAQLRHVDVEHASRIRLREAFERDQKK